MSGSEYAALYAAVSLALSSTSDYGRNSEHVFSACPVCRTYVCTTHHLCQERQP